MKVYFARHGQTDWNILAKVQGTTDIPLNENGILQAHKLCEFLKENSISFEKIYTSYQVRAKQTAQIIDEQFHTGIEVVKGLEEMNLGLFEGHTWDEIYSLYPEELKLWNSYKRYNRSPEGESYQMVLERLFKALDNIFEKYDTSSDKNLLIISHGAVIMTLLAMRNNIPFEQSHTIAIDNATPIEFSIEELNEIKRRVYMKTTNILAIGNSFSRDATAYLYDICKNMGISVHVVNLYIGGCSLERHWSNIENNERGYQYQENGVVTDRYVTISEVLHSRPWDFIVTQQSSHDSGWIDTYEPFVGLIIDYLKKEAPGAQICMQQTWAYETDSDHGCFIRYNRDQQEMYKRSRANYKQIAENYGIPLIPCGDVIQNIRKHSEFDVSKGGMSICRDGFHMHYLYGRYALACTWAKTLLHAPVQECTYLPKCCDTEEVIDKELLSLVQEEVVNTH